MSDYAYVAVRACGCVNAATVDLPEYAEAVADSLSEWVRSGRTVERTTVEDARSRLATWPCKHGETNA